MMVAACWASNRHADASREVERYKRFAEARIASEHGQLAERNATGPEPLELFAGDVVEPLESGIGLGGIAGGDHLFGIEQCQQNLIVRFFVGFDLLL